ncbi:MAG TPA: ABC transporter ATP-binding protein [Phycisphaerae bacterium]|nr:ABC transporter ATP-binding protein [Phycisphaerae bacterium]
MSRSHSKWKQLVGEYLQGHRGDAGWAVLFFLLQNIPVLAMPLFMGLMVAQVTNPSGWYIAIYSSAMVLVVLQNIPSSIMCTMKISRVSRDTTGRLRVKICRQLQQLSVLYHERTGPGRLQAKLIRDIDVLQQLPNVLFLGFVSTFFSIIVTTVIICVMAPAALILFVVMVPIVVIVHRLFGDKLKKKASEYRKSVEHMSGSLSEMIDMIPTTRAHGLEQEAIGQAEAKIMQVAKSGTAFDMITAYYKSGNWVVFVLFQVIFTISSVIMGIYGWLNVTEIIAFNGYFAGVTSSINMLLNMLPFYMQAVESYSSITEVLNAPDLEYNEGKESLDHFAGQFELQNVSYTYPDTPTPAVNQINLTIHAGQTIALVGPSGGGKSTLLKLLLGFVRPQQGQLLYDAKDGNDLDLRVVRRQVSVVTQESILFSGSIRDNISFGSEVDDEQVIEALKHANAWEFVKSLKDGLHTRLGENGVKLSGGQTQRIAIARAFVRNRKVLLLDEPTSALDLENQTLINDAFNRLSEGKTSVLVTHSLPLIRNASQIFIVENGTITRAGTHDQLMQSENYYSRNQIKITG